MSIKEKPLLKAAEKLGPLPGFLFANMVFAGFVAMLMSGVFGAVFVLFQAFGRGTVHARVLFDYVYGGFLVTLVLTSVIFIGIAVSAFFVEDEKALRLQFVAGGVLALVAVALFHWLALPHLLPWIDTIGDLQ